VTPPPSPWTTAGACFLGSGVLHLLWTVASLGFLTLGPRLPGDAIRDCYVVIDCVRFDLGRTDPVALYALSLLLGVLLLVIGRGCLRAAPGHSTT
jgi:hypothetical protein